MKKTSVYLTDDEAEELRHMAKVTGRSQAELLREGLRQMLTGTGRQERVFHSMGKGHGGGAPFEHWDADELYKKVMGLQE